MGSLDQTNSDQDGRFRNLASLCSLSQALRPVFAALARSRLPSLEEYDNSHTRSAGPERSCEHYLLVVVVDDHMEAHPIASMDARAILIIVSCSYSLLQLRQHICITHLDPADIITFKVSAQFT